MPNIISLGFQPHDEIEIDADRQNSINKMIKEIINTINYTDIDMVIETIETYLFRGCSNLKTIIIPEGVKTIEGQSFTNCSSLESVIIPNSVTTIEAFAFSRCNALKTVYYLGSQSEWNSIDISSDYDGNKTLTSAKIEYNYSL